MKKKERGITLVALVVTIIVLMILAGITLTLVLGQNGLIGKAREAKEISTNAEKATGEELNNLYNEMLTATGDKTGETMPIPVATAIGKELSATDNIAVTDDNGNTVTIPAGFKIASDSPTKQEQGIVIEDKDGNQFVWIPVASISNYIRTDFGIQSGAYSNYSETIPSDEQSSVSTYHGYYIGRYEAGDSVSTTNKTLRASGASVANKVSIKKGQAPYNYVTRDQASTLAIGMKTAEGYKATTKLCSSYAWDTAINFIQKTVANYGTSSNQGNYYDTTFSYTDITGASQTKALNASVLIPTGETTPINSIYDIGGNDWEWTTEACNYSASNPCVCRGGYCDDYYASYPAGYRSYYSTTISNYIIAFRGTLYM
jgi:formylglycine-generating enzyme required for sulfatase activity